MTSTLFVHVIMFGISCHLSGEKKKDLNVTVDSSMKTSVRCTPAAKGKMLSAFYFTGSFTQERMTGVGSGC